MIFKHKKILAIDDAPSIRTFLRISFQVKEAEFHEAITARQGVELCRETAPDAIVLDLGLPDRDGLDILPELKKENANGTSPVVVVLTVRREPHIKRRAFELGADGYLTKPFLMEDLLEILEVELKKKADPDGS